jgi:galactokinase
MPDPPAISRRSEHFFNEAEPVRAFFAPGRINIIGEHLDYNGGYVFPAAISLGITGYIQDRDDRRIRLMSEQAQGEAVADLDRPLFHAASGSWSDYPLGAIQYLRERGLTVSRGKNILFASTLPQGSGLSSSAAMEVLTAFMFSGDPHGSDEGRVRIARLMRDMENEFIGVRCGIMDQFAVALGRKDHAILLDSNTLEYEYVPVSTGEYSLIIMNTNRSRGLTDSKYNERRAECEEALRLIRGKKEELTSLAKADAADLGLIQDPALRKRARHVISEQRRVIESAAALRSGDLLRFGALLSESHLSLRDDYEVTGRELDMLVGAAARLPACTGARMTGAGFGGCAIALVRTSETGRFHEQVGDEYYKMTGLTADFFEFLPGNGVHEVK